jgi:hypothetical protein
MPKYTVPIFVDGDQERLSELQRAVVHAERRSKAAAGAVLRGGDASPDEEVEAAQAAYDEFLDEAAERAEAWVLESIGHEEFRDLLKAHPARMITETAEDGTTKDVTDPDDAAWGVNTETFPKELLLYVDPEDPEIRTVAELKINKRNIAGNAEAMRKRVKRLSEGQFDALWTNAFVLNKAGVKDPKLDRFSSLTPRSNET